MKSGIYTITNLVNNKIYVGYSTNLNKRREDHFRKLKSGNHGNRHLQYAYDKYGANSFVFEHLELCTTEFLVSCENYWCNMLQTYKKDYGYNIAITGSHLKYHSDDTRRLLSNLGKGRKLTEQHKANIKSGLLNSPKLKESTYLNSRKKIVFTDEVKAKISISKLGKPRTEETKAKISASHMNKTISGETRSKMSANSTTKRRVVRMTLSGDVIDVWDSAFDVQRVLGLDSSAILKCCKGKAKTSKGFKWKYYE